jgi:hypothetical protein
MQTFLATTYRTLQMSSSSSMPSGSECVSPSANSSSSRFLSDADETFLLLLKPPLFWLDQVLSKFAT